MGLLDTTLPTIVGAGVVLRTTEVVFDRSGKVRRKKVVTKEVVRSKRRSVKHPPKARAKPMKRKATTRRKVAGRRK